MSLLTTLVETLKVAVIDPAGIFTVVGTRALRLLDAKETVAPLVGDGPEMLIVPVVDDPPDTGDTDQITDEGIGASTFTNVL